MPISTSNATPALISTAAKLHDLEDACELIQGTLGIVQGDVAVKFFDAGKVLEWGAVGELGRLRMLADYVSCEQQAEQSTRP